jgi:hypothetical protein
LAFATTVSGDVVRTPSVGLDTLSGKSFDPLGSGGVQLDVGGVHAGGAGSGLFPGDHVIETGGVEGYEGAGGDGGVPVALFIPLVPQAVPAATTPINNAMHDILETFPAVSGAAAHQLTSHTSGDTQYGRRITTSGKKPNTAGLSHNS